MNYISWFGLVVLYPLWTLNKTGLIITDTPTTRKCFMKYTERGYTLCHETHLLTRPLENHFCGEDPYCSETKCSLYSGHFFVESFDVGEFEFGKDEEDLSWTLSAPCSFNAFKDEAEDFVGGPL